QQHVQFTRVHLTPQLLMKIRAGRAAHRVPVHAQNAGARQQAPDFLFQALGAGAEQFQLPAFAFLISTGFWRESDASAKMAAQAASWTVLMKGHADGA